MKTAENFYPGFEHAGLETPVDRALTGLVCTMVVVAAAARDIAGGVARRLGAAPEPSYDA